MQFPGEEPAEPILNDQGLAAMKCIRQQNVRIEHPDKTAYHFNAKANVWLDWVKPEHIQWVKDQKHKCCGRPRSIQVFFLANASDVRIWTNNGGR